MFLSIALFHSNNSIRVSIVNDEYPRIANTLRNTTFDKKYPNSVVIIYSNEYIANFASAIPNASKVFKELQLTRYSNKIYYVLYRLLLQPINEIKERVLKYSLSDCIGIQVRMGGKLANERVEFLNKPSLYRYLNRINKDNINKTIYLSTDSELVINDIKEQLSNNKVIVANDYKIGHSGINSFSNGDHLIGVKRALVDVFLASQCNPIYITKNSTFGDIIHYLSNYSKTIVMNNH